MFSLGHCRVSCMPQFGPRSSIGLDCDICTFRIWVGPFSPYLNYWFTILVSQQIEVTPGGIQSPGHEATCLQAPDIHLGHQHSCEIKYSSDEGGPCRNILWLWDHLVHRWPQLRTMGIVHIHLVHTGDAGALHSLILAHSGGTGACDAGTGAHKWALLQ